MSDQVIHVLSIEDNRAEATLIQEMLAAATGLGWDLPRFEVEHVEQLQAALARLEAAAEGEAGAIDVVLSDLDLPDSQASQTVATLREHIPRMPIVVLTGREDESLAHKSVRAGVQDYLYKEEATGSLLARTMLYAIERQQVHAGLKQRVDERTAELRQANEELRAEIAGRKRAEEALQESLEKYRVLFESFPLGITVADSAGQILETNEESERLLGISREEHEARSIDGEAWHIIRPDGSPMPAEEYASVRALREGRLIENVEMGIVKSDGDVTWINVTAAPLRDRMVITYNDVTERKRAEDALRESERRYQELFENSRDGLVVVDAEGRFLEANQAYCQMLGYTLDELKQKVDFYEITPPRWRDWERREIWEKRLLQEGYSGVYEKEYVRKDGTIFPVELQSYTVFDEEGEPRYLWGVARDITERKRAAEALQESEQWLSTTLRSIGDGVIATDAQGRVRLMNPTAEALTGWDEAEAIAEPLEEVFHIVNERTGERAESPLESVLREGVIVGLANHTALIAKDGTKHSIADSAAPIEDQAGAVIGTILVFRDVSERKRAERELERRRQLWDALMENTPDLVYFKDNNHRMIRASRAYADVLEMDVEDVVGKTALELWPEGEEIIADERKVLAGEPLIRKERKVTVPGGDSVWYLLTKIPIYQDGDVIGFFAIDKDITERKQVEERLAFQSMLLDKIEDKVTATDLEGRITYVNEAESRAFGKAVDELIGQHVEEYGEDPERGATQQEIIDATLTEGRWRGEVVNITEDGREIILDSRTQLIYDEGGEPIGMLGISTDVTERKRAEEQLEHYAAELERSNRDLEQFGSIVSHDLQAPLRVVKNYLQILQDRYDEQLDSRADRYIATAVDSARRMQKMIRALLDLSRVGTQGAAFAPTDVEAVLERTLKVLDREIEDAEAEVTHDPLPTVMADEAQLTQVFQNLIANGIKFRREDVPPRVHVSAERAGDEWLFSVADNGIGIDPEQNERVFRIFQRLHTEDEYPGLGLGLALCKRIVERHGGRIWVESEIGEGATLTFALPV